MVKQVQVDVDLVGITIEVRQDVLQNNKMEVVGQEEDVLWKLKTSEHETIEEDKTSKMKVWSMISWKRIKTKL